MTVDNGTRPAGSVSGDRTSNGAETTVDAVIVGAGFGGLRALHEMRELGLSSIVIEAADNVGGTWFWNRYPGARTDSESWVYAFPIPEIQDEWDWTERFPTQSEALGYLNFVADRLDMRRNIQFETRVTSAEYDEQSSEWIVRTDTGDTFRCTYFVPAAGPLSVPYKPDFAGLDDFRGEWHVTGRWPHEGVDFAGKRVAVIGTGATGVQLIPIISHTASEVTVFQRTPNFVLPARNYTLTSEERQGIRANYDSIWEKSRLHFFGFPMDMAGRTINDVTPEEAQKILEWGWEIGGFHFIFETFDDILVDPKSNQVVADFVRDKIRSIVTDPKTADLLCPENYPIAGKRPPLGHFYYETFNRENVTLIDVSETAISGITEKGVKVGDREYEVDIIVFATGFDAVTGSYRGLDIRGRDGRTLADAWTDGPRTQLGIGVEGFPNMFMIGGPQTPFANIPVVIDGVVEWIGDAIRFMRDKNVATMEPTGESMEIWRQTVNAIVDATVLSQGPNSWFLGDNIPGKPRAALFYFGGVGAFREACQQVASGGYDSYVFSPAQSVAVSN